MKDKRSILLTKEEERELVQKAQKGDEQALEKLVDSNRGYLSDRCFTTTESLMAPSISPASLCTLSQPTAC